MTENTLIVFFKYPEPGKVKTRLAKEVGNDKACEIYKLLFNLTSKVCLDWSKKSKFRKVIYYGAGNRDFSHTESLNSIKHQNGKDLGLRMENAIREELNFSQKVCIIGTDLPTLSIELLEQAFKNLDSNETVFGPASDGGFYLFGSRSLPVNCFTDIVWSSENTLQCTMQRFEGLHCSVSLLNELTDIDSHDDYLKYASLLL